MRKQSMMTAATAALFVVVFTGPWAAQAQGPGGRGGRMEGGPLQSPLLQALDTDHDGELSAKELENAKTALETLDKNKDGRLTRDEIMPQGFGRTGRGGRGGQTRDQDSAEIVTMLMTFDKNKDGKLTKEELPDSFKALMDRADVNKDGFLDKTELTAFVARQPRPTPGGNAPDAPRRKRGAPDSSNRSGNANTDA
jgi:Ca2+-binding EF-hand superfamily protein